MRCPRCNRVGTRVIDSRDLEVGEAPSAGGGNARPARYRFTTYERPEGARLTVIKRDGSRQDFDRTKLLGGPAARPREAAGDHRAGRAGRRRHRERPARTRRAGGHLQGGRPPGDRGAARHRPAGLHPLRIGLSQLRGHLDPQARGRPPDAQRRRRSSGGVVLSDRDIRAEIEAGRIVIDPFVPEAVQPSSVDLHLDRPLSRLPQQPLPVHRRARGAAGADRAGRDRRRRAVHPAPRRVRARLHPGARAAAGRPRRPVGRQDRAWAGSAC